MPSVGVSGGIFVSWKGSKFMGSLVSQNYFSIKIEFTSFFSGASFTLTIVYGPCTLDQKLKFISWFHNIDIDDEVDWIIMGDFNLI